MTIAPPNHLTLTMIRRFARSATSVVLLHPCGSSILIPDAVFVNRHKGIVRQGFYFDEAQFAFGIL